MRYDNTFVRLWRKKHPDRYKAHGAVFIALRNGTLKKMPCEKCGEQKSEAHHEDYSKPLEVTWLCKYHHKIADQERRKRELLTDDICN